MRNGQYNMENTTAVQCCRHSIYICWGASLLHYRSSRIFQLLALSNTTKLYSFHVIHSLFIFQVLLYVRNTNDERHTSNKFLSTRTPQHRFVSCDSFTNVIHTSAWLRQTHISVILATEHNPTCMYLVMCIILYSSFNDVHTYIRFGCECRSNSIDKNLFFISFVFIILIMWPLQSL